MVGEGLRSLLVLEARSAALGATQPHALSPALVPAGCSCVRAEFTTAGGLPGAVVLAAPQEVLDARPLLEHALRQALVSDALSLQFRLPPPAFATPAPRRALAVAGGAPTVDVAALTAVWAVELLRRLSAQPNYRGLVALGIAGVGSSAVAGYTPADAARFAAVAASAAALDDEGGAAMPDGGAQGNGVVKKAAAAAAVC